MTSDRMQEITDRFNRLRDEMHAPITDENMLGCIEELREIFIRRGIAAHCTLASPIETIQFRLEGPPPNTPSTLGG